MAGQIEAPDGIGTGYCLNASLHIRREAKAGSAFFLQSVDNAFAGALDWEIIPNKLKLQNLALGFRAQRETGQSTWESRFQFRGDIGFGSPGVIATAEGRLDVRDVASLLSLDFSVTARGCAAGLELVDFLSGTALNANATAELPPSMSFAGAKKNPFSARLDLAREGGTGGTWALASAVVRILWSDPFWVPGDVSTIYLQDLFFRFAIVRRKAGGAVPPAETRSDGNFDYALLIGGSLVLQDLLVSASLKYASESKTFTLLCALPEAGVGTLQDLLCYEALNPPGAKEGHDIVKAGSARPVPEAVPVDLAWCDKAGGSDRKLVLCFQEATLTRLQLSAALGQPWQVSDKVTVTNMGIFFDIENPRALNGTTTRIRGYAYGTVDIGSLRVNGFVAGVSDATQSAFLLALSAELDPAAPLKHKPEGVFGALDQKISGVAATYVLPESFPSSGSVTAVLAAVEAKVVLQLSQAKVREEYKVSLDGVAASLTVAPRWLIFPGVELESVGIGFISTKKLAADNTTTWAYMAELSGKVSSAQATASSAAYSVVLTARVFGESSEASKFTASVVAYLAQPDKPAPPNDILQMDFVGLAGVNVLAESTGKEAAAITMQPDMPRPDQVLTSASARCTLSVVKGAEGWYLDELDAFLDWPKPWTILGGKVTISDTQVGLKITQPRNPSERTMEYYVTTTVTLGAVRLSGRLSATQQDGGSVLLIKLAATNSFQGILQHLTGSRLTLPPGSPISGDVGPFLFSVGLECVRLPGKDLKLSRLTVDMVAGASATEAIWRLGPLEIRSLLLRAIITNPTSSDRTIRLSFRGTATMAGSPFDLDVLYGDSKLEVQPSSYCSLKTASTVFLGPAGLTKDMVPSLPGATGLEDYLVRRGDGTAVRLLASYRGGAWTWDELALVASTSRSWQLVDGVLQARGLSARFAMRQPASEARQLLLVLHADFVSTGPKGVVRTVPCDLTATMRQLEAAIDTSACTLPSFVYVGTAGFLALPDWMDFPVITPRSLYLHFNWLEGRGGFTALCGDWNLTKYFDGFVAVERPTLDVAMTRQRGSITASGRISMIAK